MDDENHRKDAQIGLIGGSPALFVGDRPVAWYEAWIANGRPHVPGGPGNQLSVTGAWLDEVAQWMRETGRV